MTVLVTVLVALAIAIGLAGIVVPVLPGVLLIAAAVLGWAVYTGGTTAWVVFAVVMVLLAAGQVVKYLVPGQRLKEAGIPASTQWVGVLLGLIGFFVIPVIGIFVGFVLGIYLWEAKRLGTAEAWPSTKHALKAAGLSILIELASATLATIAWVVGVVAYAV